MKQAEVILPLPLHGSFTYNIPGELVDSVKPGSRVVVQFGAKKIYTGIILSVSDAEEHSSKAKPLIEVLDNRPIINEIQLSFFKWISRYYMSTLGEVINAALPSALKLSSQSYIGISPDANILEEDLQPREYALLSAIQKNDLAMSDVGGLVGLKHPQRLVKSMVEKGYLDLFEKLKDRYVPKTVRRIRIAQDYAAEENLDELLEALKARSKQIEVLVAYLRLVPVLEDPSVNIKGVEKSLLLKEDISASSLKTLVKNGILEEWEEVVSRLEKQELATHQQLQLSPAQTKCHEEIKVSFAAHRTVLLHGVTGSGKTEVFMQLIEEQLHAGKQVLYLLPEIALTTQIISRLHKVFGNKFGVYHSRYSDNERVEVWKNVQNGNYQFVVGVRSAIFLPFDDLGLIIVDEEHEPSYKQFDPSPRYNARDAASYLGNLHDAKVLLGTATPSLETYQNALDKKFGLVELLERYGDASDPELLFVDMIKERKAKRLKGNFSSTLYNEIEDALKNKEQVILFQNRRGYASYVNCENCAYIPKCINCAVSLTYHQFNHKLVCHYCGYHLPMTSDCTNCGSTSLKNVGFGTEELEEELKILFPSAIIQRMDLDTTRSKHSYQRIIEDFEDGSVDILVGTQMVSKGLDFDHVNLVGIFDVDRMIHFPDFRSHERAYQLITQVSGRAGRKSNKGRVIIQSNDPMQPLLQRARESSYREFFQWESMERQQFAYPPNTRMITITHRHRDKTITFEAATFFSKELRKSIGMQRVVGPVEPLIGKIRNKYLQETSIRIEKKGVNLPAIKELLWACEKMMQQVPAFKSVDVIFDVDPL